MLIFTIIGIIIGIVIFINYYWGCTLVVAAKLLVPTVVRFQLGPLDISFATFLVFLLFVAFLVKRKYKSKSPQKLFTYLFIFIASSFLIIPLASFIPYSIQISSNVQFIITELLLACLVWYGITEGRQLQRFCAIFLCATIIVCIYGIFTYIWKINPYIEVLTLVYEPTQFVAFMDEDRGVLEGRISATTPHPLSWGQFLGILLGIFLLLKKNMTSKQTFIKSLISDVFVCFCIALFLINIFLTGSRTVLGTTLILFFFAFLSYPTYKKVCIIFVASVSFVLLMLVPSGSSSELTQLKGNLFFWDSSAADKAGVKGSSSELRESQLNSVFDLVSGGYQFFGLGKGLVENRQNLNVRVKNIEDLYGFESIVYYKIAEQGLIGLILFLLLYMQIYIYIRKEHIDCFNDRSRYLVDGFFISYLVSITMTGIQSTFSYFLLASIIYLKYLEQMKRNSFQNQTNTKI